ncbi:uncharacterized protein LOC110907486 [Helianthus annuus]|uniref:uncharacterized protein LOC110907486 n=1 Tax=Helianthus annuus TaxID=4232 RepID=UPI000B8F3BC0|nr:uncharacterized protein LOC110907486 [Helianthus annuus]
MIAQGLLNGGLPFRSHDESEESIYRGHFIEFLKLFGQINEAIGKVILSNAPVDESRDISKKEQMAVVLRYIDKLGFVKERFIGLVHVKETTALSLKSTTDEVFARYNLSLGRMSMLTRKNRRKKTNITNRHHFVVNNFNTVLDMQIQELGKRFNELAEMYLRDYTFDEKDDLIDELSHYIRNVKKDSRFNNLNGISDLAKKMVETRKHIDYQLVYRLMKLSMVLPGCNDKR